MPTLILRPASAVMAGVWSSIKSAEVCRNSVATRLTKVKAGETISLVDLANAVKADKERGKEAKPEKKPSIRAQLRADKEKAQKKNAKQKLQDLERS